MGRNIPYLYNNQNLQIQNGGIIVIANPGVLDLEKALRLTYDVYLEEGHIKENNLSNEQRKSGMLWDEYDYSPNTIQVVAKKNDNVIGRGRLIDKKSPLSESFDTRGIVNLLRESSRFVISKEHRSPKLMIEMFRLAYWASHQVTDICWSSFELPHLLKLYEGMGADIVDTFQNPHYPDSPSYVFKWELEKMHNPNARGPKTSNAMVNKITKPILMQ